MHYATPSSRSQLIRWFIFSQEKLLTAFNSDIWAKFSEIYNFISVLMKENFLGKK